MKLWPARKVHPSPPAGVAAIDGSALHLVPGGSRTRARTTSWWPLSGPVQVRVAAAVAVASLALAGWTTFGPNSPGRFGPSAAFTADQVAPDVANARGNYGKVVGQVGVLSAPDGTPQMQATLTAITTDFICPAEGAPAPSNGHYVAVTMDLRTTTGYGSGPGDGQVGFPAYPSKFMLLDPDGVVQPETGLDQIACLGEAGTMPTAMGSDGGATVQVVFDTELTAGSIVFTPGAWEWEF